MCEQYRIPRSHYNGGPLEWTAEDRDLAEAYAAWRVQCCTSCGTHPDWWDPAKGGDRNALIADTRRCPGCEIKEQLQEQVRESDGSKHGISVFLTPNPELFSDITDLAKLREAVTHRG